MSKAPAAGADTGKARRTAPRHERWQQLIDAAMESIAIHGLTGTTTAIVTEKAGLSAGIVSLHFGNKENLLSATLEHLVLEHRCKWVEAMSDTTLDPASRIWALMEAHFDPEICTPTKVAVWFAFFGEARHRATYRRISERFDTERSDFLESCCRQIIDEGGYRNVNPERFAQLVESTADGLWLDLLLYPEELDRDYARSQIRDVLHAIFPQHFAPLEAPAGERP